MNTIENLWNEAAKQCYASHFVNCHPLWQHAITRFAELVRADCQAVPTETVEQVYDAVKRPGDVRLSSRDASYRMWVYSLVDRARSGPPKVKTPGERLREFCDTLESVENLNDAKWWESEAAKLIGGNDG